MKKKDVLIKLVEELGELLHAVSKKQRYMKKPVHDGRLLDDWIEKEMADVIAMLIITRLTFGLNQSKINRRINEKVEKHLGQSKQKPSNLPLTVNLR